MNRHELGRVSVACGGGPTMDVREERVPRKKNSVCEDLMVEGITAYQRN